MKFTAVCVGVATLLVILATGEGRQTLSEKIAQRRLRRQTQQSSVYWLTAPAKGDCEIRYEDLEVTACGSTRRVRVPTCEGQCHSETTYEEQPDGSFTIARNCNCCFIQDGSIEWYEPFPECPERVRVPQELKCECNKCLRDVEIRDGAPFSIA